jgi:flagellar hook assembly protein FlgD
LSTTLSTPKVDPGSFDTGVAIVRRLVPVLVAGLLAVAGAIAPSPLASAAAAVSSDPKIVLVVGATQSATSSYRSGMDEVYATARQYSSNVVKVYSPDATWAAVRAAMQGASIVVYMGHGNGFPSPYRTSPYPASQNGFGLNAAAGQGDSNNVYYGESYISGSVTLAPNAVVILNHLCYASGNSEPGQPEPTLAVAEARIDNYAAGFLAAGARAVIADAHSDASWYVDQLFTTHQTLDQLFRAKPWGAGNTFTFESMRSPGFTAYSDPDEAAPAAEFYRSMVAGPTLRTDDVTGAKFAVPAGDPVNLTVPGAAEVTGPGGVGLYPDPNLAPDPATGAAPALLPDGTRLRLLASMAAPMGGLAYQVTTVDGMRGGFVAPAGLAPRDGGPPEIGGLAVTPAPFSPALGASAVISATASKPVDWSVAVLDAAGTVVTQLSATGLAFNAAWDGRTQAGVQAPDGTYQVVATAIDGWGNPPATVRTALAVDGTPPSLALTSTRSAPTLLSPNGDGLNETASVAFLLSEAASVVASVRDAAGVVVATSTRSTAAGPGAFTWDGLGTGGARVPDGSYLLDLAPRDAAGNVGPSVLAPVVVATSRSGLAAAPAWISPASRTGDPRASNLSFTLAHAAMVTWRVSTTAGVPVRTWYAGSPLDAGVHVVRWDGRSDTGALVPRGRYLSQVTVDDGMTSTTEQIWVYSDGIRITISDTTPAAGQAITITAVAVEALGALPSAWITQPGRARIGYRMTRVGTSTYSVRLVLKAGQAGPMTVKVSGIDRFGRAAGSTMGYRLH